MKYLILAIAGFLSLSSQLANPQLVVASETETIPLENVPVRVSEAADATFVDVIWVIARRESSGWYSLGGLNGRRKFVEYRCDGNGNNGYFRIVIRLDEVPEAVMSSLKTHLPNATVTRAQSTGLADGKVMGYRFEAYDLPAGFNCFYISASGKKFELAKN
jgi:hypothetical protein